MELDIKSIVFGVIVASSIWLIIYLYLAACVKKTENKLVQGMLQLIDYYDRSIEHFKGTIRDNNKKIITEDEMIHMKNLP